MNSTSVVYTSMIVQMKQTFARNMFKFTLFISPFLFTIILGEMHRYSNSANFVAYVVLGAGLWSLWGSIAFSSAGDIHRERFSNTLSIIFSAPADFRLIILGKILGNTILSLGSFSFSVIFATLLYGYPITVNNWGLLVLSFSLLIVSFIVISVFVAYLLTLSRKTTLFMNCIEIPCAILWGFAFPIEALPRGVQFISYIFPPTWAVRLLRSSIVETDYIFLNNLIALVVTLSICIILTAVLYKIIFKQTKILGTLEMA